MPNEIVTRAIDAVASGQDLTEDEARDVLREIMNGDPRPRRYSEPSLPGLRQRIGFAVSSWSMTAPPTQTQRDAYGHAANEFVGFLATLRNLVENDLGNFREKLDDEDGKRAPEEDDRAAGELDRLGPEPHRDEIENRECCRRDGHGPGRHRSEVEERERPDDQE